MDKDELIIDVEELPDDLSKIPEDAIIVLNDYDPMEDDSFWEDE